MVFCQFVNYVNVYVNHFIVFDIPLHVQGVEICPVQFGKYERSDRFWSELAYKTYSWKLELQNADDLRVVITVAIYRGKGKECLQVN